MGDLYDSNDDSRFLQYLDANNLYGWAMAWKAALKITGVKLELLTDIDLLLMFEKGIRVGILHRQ